MQALVHGLNRHYYSIGINYRKNELEQKMLLNLHKKNWDYGLSLKVGVCRRVACLVGALTSLALCGARAQDFKEHGEANTAAVEQLLKLAKAYTKSVEEEGSLTKEQLAIRNVGKQDPKRHLSEKVSVLMSDNIVQCLGAMLDTVVFR